MYTITTDKSMLDIELIHGFLSEHSYWAQNISREIVDPRSPTGWSLSVIPSAEEHEESPASRASVVHRRGIPRRLRGSE